MYKELLNNIRHTAQQKMGKRLEQKLRQRRYANNKQAHEKVLNTISNQQNAY